ncbi:MAG: hypothetical protein ACIAQF_08855 [Phycisphaerales bacterium JB065]
MPHPQNPRPSGANSRQLLRASCEAVNGLALGLWAGVILMVGVTAAVTFPLMADLDVRVPGYEAYDGAQHRIAAGQVLNQAFAVSDWLGIAALLICIGCIAGLWFAGPPAFRTMRAGLVLRLTSFGALAVLTLFQTFAFRPSLNRSFEELWQAAEAGENQRAEQVRDALAPQHAKASFMLTTQLTLVLIAGLSAGFDAASTSGASTPRPTDSDGASA